MLTIPNIRTSIENKAHLVIDEHAKNGTFDRDSRGRLIAYSGGFSVVFPYQATDGHKWAFRCWHTDIGNSKKRYEIISNAIRNAGLNFLCEFEYVVQGISVDGKIYPITRMRWIEGVTIKDYICQNRASKILLVLLADNFLRMTRELHLRSLAHGDLQHGNILVDKNHQLYLVDYDSFYCPKLMGEEDTVSGLADYQHPARIRNKSVSEKLDYFSELIIYISILAIAENPALIDKYKVKDADRLLFSKEDFSDIRNSNIYKDIQGLGKNFQELLDILEAFLTYKSIDELLPFNIFMLERKVSFSASATKAIRNKQAIIIEWNVPFEADVYLKNGHTKKCKNNGQISTILEKRTSYELLVIKENGVEIKKEIAIEVFDECEIDFLADKYYVFPTIPVKLSWNVKHAKKIWLDGKEVNETGIKVIEPLKETVCILHAEDEFGKKEKRIVVGMLPIPQIKSIQVPLPDIVNNLAISIIHPKYNVNVSFPHIKIGMLKTEVPKVPSFTEMGLNVELSSPIPRFSLKQSVKNIFNQLIRKNNERKSVINR